MCLILFISFYEISGYAENSKVTFKSPLVSSGKCFTEFIENIGKCIQTNRIYVRERSSLANNCLLTKFLKTVWRMLPY